MDVESRFARSRHDENILEEERMRSWKGVAASVAAVALLAGTAWTAGTQTRAHAKAASTAADEGPPNKSLGSRNAPIRMEVFSDYSCPVCKAFYMRAVRPMLESYVAEGKVYLIHRDYPLKGVQGHEHSREAAEYANAAARIGRFQEVDAALYDKQEIWTRGGSPNATVDATVAAVLTPRDMKRVQEIVKSHEMDPYIDSDTALGESRGVRATPTIYITANGKTNPLPGNVSYELLRQYLNEQLQK
jgi:protein-disulfide isomerase